MALDLVSFHAVREHQWLAQTVKHPAVFAQHAVNEAGLLPEHVEIPAVLPSHRVHNVRGQLHAHLAHQRFDVGLVPKQVGIIHVEQVAAFREQNVFQVPVAETKKHGLDGRDGAAANKAQPELVHVPVRVVLQHVVEESHFGILGDAVQRFGFGDHRNNPSVAFHGTTAYQTMLTNQSNSLLSFSVS